MNIYIETIDLINQKYNYIYTIDMPYYDNINYIDVFKSNYLMFHQGLKALLSS